MDPLWLIWEKTLKFVPSFLRLCPVYLFPSWSCIVSFLCNKPWPRVQQDFPSGSPVKNPPANAGDTGDVGLIPRSGKSEKEMATPSSTLAWKIPCTEEPRGLPSIRLQGVGHDLATKHMSTARCWMLCIFLENHWTWAQFGGLPTLKYSTCNTRNN